MDKTKIEYRKLTDLVPYENNPRNNDSAVDAVAASIEEFGFLQPIVIDKDDIIVAGHTRHKAAEKLGLKEVPTIKAEDLTKEQIKAYRLADNKTAELADWNFILLDSELKDLGEIDMSEFGFNLEEDEEYKEFVEKFEPKKTTDDCYTPPIVYDAIADWVAKEYKIKRENFVRPFKPGGDFTKEKYKKTDIVVDNPPFSILAEIIKWYDDKNIKFFLFAPTLTLFSSSSSSCALPCGGKITYENGAVVPTSFVTNLENNRIRVIPELYKIVEAANEENQKQYKKKLPKYKYPNEVLTAAMCRYMCEHDTALTIKREDSYHYRQLDAQKEKDGSAIFGSGYLLSEKAAAEKAAAEVWELSEREKEIIRSLGQRHGKR